ncbi:hypothetical protein [uncultured Gordonia sp.]|nr:hypothetical protein [uncultured Gordonia sp.]HNP57630.1 hypothetical protein [Gordonia sp. (in: high G+C Gram-positive bacteria)]
MHEARVDFVPDPRGGEQLWPALTVIVWYSGLEALTVNYRVVLADAD